MSLLHQYWSPILISTSTHRDRIVISTLPVPASIMESVSRCDHLKDLRKTPESSSFELLHAVYVSCIWPGSSKNKTLLTSCHVCHKSSVGARLHACLSCVFIGCLKGHFEKHNEKHKYAMDLLSGAIYCFECKDYAYDEHFSNVAKSLQPSGQIKESIHWVPPKEDWEFFKVHRPVKLNQSHVGKRGLYNLGFTCYVNCIIQVFANTPMMRNYFLSGRHLCHLEKNDCQACLLSEIFQELYSGEKEPLALPKLVYDIWIKNETFCDNRAQDAQEFYQFYLNDLHEYCKENVSEPCRCVIHQIFSGKYQNDKICPNCGVLSSSLVESWSVSLHYGDSNGETKLTDCIEKFIQGTILTNESNENIICKECKTGIVRDQLLFKVLPNILCFHFPIKSEEKLKTEKLEGEKLKREKLNKDKTRISFPEYLDMSSYTSETAKSIWNENGILSLRSTSKKNMYILYAIVCHKGVEQESGHYYSYVRKSKDTWHKCSDEEITSVELEEVSKCSGSLFFYIKEVLEYEKTSLNESETSLNESERFTSGHVNGYR